MTDHFKTDARVPLRHRGEQDWRQYRAALVQTALPHRWWDSSDTHLRLAHFEKNRRAATRTARGGGVHAAAAREHSLAGAVHRQRMDAMAAGDRGEVARSLGLEHLTELSGGHFFASKMRGDAEVAPRRGRVAAVPGDASRTEASEDMTAVAADTGAAAVHNVIVAHLHDGIEVLQVRSCPAGRLRRPCVPRRGCSGARAAPRCRGLMPTLLQVPRPPLTWTWLNSSTRVSLCAACPLGATHTAKPRCMPT